MPVTPGRRPSAAAIADVYEDVAPVIDRAARRFARRYNQDYEEAKAEARLHFLTEYLNGKLAGSGSVEGRTAFLVFRRLQSRVRLDAQRSRKLRRHPLSSVGGESVPPPFDLNDLLQFVSEDATTVLTLLFSDPQLEEMIRTDPKPGPSSIRRALEKRLREMGWTIDRVADSFWEITEELSNH